MKKNMKVIAIIAAVIVIAIIAIVIVMMNQKPKTNLPEIKAAEDLSTLIDTVYEGQENLLGSLMTQTVDVTDKDFVNMVTGLENGSQLEYVAVSEPMISSQAYSFVLAKVKDGVDANEVAKQMSEKINPSKWLCVTAEKIYATSSGDIVCLVMASEEWAKPIYEKFKTVAGTIGEEYEKTQEEVVMDEMNGMEDFGPAVY